VAPRRRYKLDKEEKELLASVERGEWVSVNPTKKELQRYAQAARNTLRKTQRINIRLTAYDLEGLRAKAVEEGIPYQTLIASVLHKYVSGRLRAA
jgi:predicted DNA binding CopG/RHH family protein